MPVGWFDVSPRTKTPLGLLEFTERAKSGADISRPTPRGLSRGTGAISIGRSTSVR
jgi:hypothetical protein